MKQIGAYDAKTKLPEILRRVAGGKSFTITHHGKPVADLVPSQEARQARARTAIDRILKSRKPVVTDAELKVFKESGRK